jgi:1-acyl-sn-glycerol-3-phosphate acyltransferase
MRLVPGGDPSHRPIPRDRRTGEPITRALETGAAPSPVSLTRVVDPARDRWVSDHCPTFTVPALPMMAIVDQLLAAVPEARTRAAALSELRVLRWLLVEGPTTLETKRTGDVVELFANGERVASAKVRAPRPRPAAWAAITGAPEPSPYETGELFHGPAFHKLRSLVRAADGSASAILDASTDVEGTTNLVLLDAATHAIRHEDGDHVYYPALVPELDLFAPLPREGDVRCEVRPEPHAASSRFPAYKLQLIRGDVVVAELRLVEAGFPKARLGRAAPLDRRRFLRDHTFVPGLRMSRDEGGATILTKADVDAHDWLPGTVLGVYGTRDLERLALKEHLAHRTGLHPRVLPEALPLTRVDVDVTRSGDEVTVRDHAPKFEDLSQGTGSRSGVAPSHGTRSPATLDVTPVRDFWRQWFARGPWPIEDLYYGLAEHFVGRVVVEDPAAFDAVRGRSVLYLANHQVGIESLMFSVIASGLAAQPTVTLAKIEHQNSWLGQLIERSFDYPGIRDPEVISFFDRGDRESLPRIISDLASKVHERSLMVHVEGTRALTCRAPVEKMSGAFIDMAIAVGAPIIPVRFVGALPVEPLAERLELPVGMGRQELWLGRPLDTAELAKVPYGERKRRVVGAINGLGPSNADERPCAPEPALAAEAQRTMIELGTTHERATLITVLRNTPPSCEETRTLLAAIDGDEPTGTRAEDEWIRRFARWLRSPAE